MQINNNDQVNTKKKLSYGEAILAGFEYLLENHQEVFVLGQGLWSPWYVGNTMTDLEKKFGYERIMDSPVSEMACTGAAVGAALCGYRPIVVHPRVDFMLYAMDPIVNQAAKWSHMLGGQAHPAITIRGIVNRGGEQGAQHSQALHSWFAHIPGLRVVMPATVQDARDLLISSVLCDDPVLYIDDRWLYEQEMELPEITIERLEDQHPEILKLGTDVTLVGSSYCTLQCMQAANALESEGISCEVIDLRVINPLHHNIIIESVNRTGRLLVVDGGWKNCGLAGEIISRVCEEVDSANIKAKPSRVTLTDSPAPTSSVLEDQYYPKVESIVKIVRSMATSS